MVGDFLNMQKIKCERERERVSFVMHEKGGREGVAFLFCARIRGVVGFKCFLVFGCC